MRYDRGRKARTRALLLKEAAGLIRAEGIERFSLGRVTRRVGLTTGGFYSHFASRDDLIVEAIGYMFEERYAAFFAELGTGDAASLLGRFVERYLSLAHAAVPERGCPVPSLASQVLWMPPRARDRFRSDTDRLTAGLEFLARRAGIADPEAVVGSVIAEMVGAVSLARMNSTGDRAEIILNGARRSVMLKLWLVA